MGKKSENPYKFDRPAQDAACRAMAQTGNRQAAADAAGIALSTLQRYVCDDPDFKARLMDAKAAYVRTLEAEAHRRAVEGWDEDKMGAGGVLYSVRKLTDPLLLQLLKTKAPEEHRESIRVEQKTEVTGSIGLNGLSAESRVLLRQILEKETDGEGEEGED